MKCCVSFCGNTSGNVSTASGITFHVVPYDVYQRIAWLRALRKEEYELPTCPVVCSEHFLDEDFSEAQCGLRELQADAVPLLLQVCLICLATDCKLYTLGKYKLETVYENLTKSLFYNDDNLPRTVCGECKQRMMNYSKFREKSRTSNSLLMGLLKEHEELTLENVKTINRKVNKLTSSMVKKVFEPDHFDLYMQESTEQIIGSGSNYTIYKVASNVKVEHEESNDESQEDQSDVEFKDYTSGMDNTDRHVSNLDHSRYNLRSGTVNVKMENEEVEVGVTTLTDPNVMQMELQQKENIQDVITTGYADRWPVVKVEYDSQMDSAEVVDSPSLEGDEDKKVDPLLLHEIYRKKKLPHTSSQMEEDNKIENLINVKIEDDNTLNSKLSTNSTTSARIKIEDMQPSVSSSKERDKNTSIDDPTLEKISNVTHNHKTDIKIKKEPICDKKSFTCAICQKKYTQKFVKHMENHTGTIIVCDNCQRKFTQKDKIDVHMKTFMPKKPFICGICYKKYSEKSNLIIHMKSHTSKKRHPCSVCKINFIKKSDLLQHMQTHKIEKPFSCHVCDRRFSYQSTFMMHMKMHTGDTPFACDCCKEKFTVKANLAIHMNTHTGDKPK